MAVRFIEVTPPRLNLPSPLRERAGTCSSSAMARAGAGTPQRLRFLSHGSRRIGGASQGLAPRCFAPSAGVKCFRVYATLDRARKEPRARSEGLLSSEIQLSLALKTERNTRQSSANANSPKSAACRGMVYPSSCGSVQKRGWRSPNSAGTGHPVENPATYAGSGTRRKCTTRSSRYSSRVARSTLCPCASKRPERRTR